MPEVRDQRTEVNNKNMRIGSAKDLAAYQIAYKLAMEIFEITKTFPPEEKYALFKSTVALKLLAQTGGAKRFFQPGLYFL